jgi:hypothetical protein
LAGAVFPGADFAAPGFAADRFFDAVTAGAAAASAAMWSGTVSGRIVRTG